MKILNLIIICCMISCNQNSTQVSNLFEEPGTKILYFSVRQATVSSAYADLKMLNIQTGTVVDVIPLFLSDKIPCLSPNLDKICYLYSYKLSGNLDVVLQDLKSKKKKTISLTEKLLVTDEFEMLSDIAFSSDSTLFIAYKDNFYSYNLLSDSLVQISSNQGKRITNFSINYKGNYLMFSYLPDFRKVGIEKLGILDLNLNNIQYFDQYVEITGFGNWSPDGQKFVFLNFKDEIVIYDLIKNAFENYSYELDEADRGIVQVKFISNSELVIATTDLHRSVPIDLAVYDITRNKVVKMLNSDSRDEVDISVYY